jgi:hypothetical protein
MEINPKLLSPVGGWLNNCAVNCLVPIFIDDLFSDRIQTNFLLDPVYQTLLLEFRTRLRLPELTWDDLKNLFSSELTNPYDQEMVVGDVFRSFIKNVLVHNPGFIKDSFKAFKHAALEYLSENVKHADEAIIITNTDFLSDIKELFLSNNKELAETEQLLPSQFIKKYEANLFDHWQQTGHISYANRFSIPSVMISENELQWLTRAFKINYKPHGKVVHEDTTQYFEAFPESRLKENMSFGAGRPILVTVNIGSHWERLEDTYIIALRRREYYLKRHQTDLHAAQTQTRASNQIKMMHRTVRRLVRTMQNDSINEQDPFVVWKEKKSDKTDCYLKANAIVNNVLDKNCNKYIFAFYFQSLTKAVAQANVEAIDTADKMIEDCNIDFQRLARSIDDFDM